VQDQAVNTPLLDADGIRRLDRVYRRAYAHAIVERQSEPLARHIHLPKLPELLSLSIAALVGPHLIGAELARGRPPHDLRTHANQDIAVKGTGPSRWITVTAADRQAHILIWVDYAARITRGSVVEVLAVRVRDGLADAPRVLTRSQLEKRTPSLQTLAIDPETLPHGDATCVLGDWR
jgi:hypothetical protein